MATFIIGFIAGPAVSLRSALADRKDTALIYLRNGTNNNATIFATFIMGLIAGPAVSLR